jgi:DNA-binding transcriptional ArsR family regulator
MSQALDLAGVGALVGDPSRANMLGALIGGEALTATELAHVAGVTPATASAHLGRLEAAGLMACAAQGRRRYYRLASPAIAAMLEAMMVVADRPEPRRRATPRISPELRAARTCYDHLAGRLGVALADALVAQGAVALAGDAGEVTPRGRALLADFGVAPDAAPRTRRVYCRPCLDWSERRPHLAGSLGAALLARTLELGWTRRAGGRVIAVTPRGREGFLRTFGIEAAATGAASAG